MPRSDVLHGPEWGERLPAYKARRRVGAFAVAAARSETAERLIVPEDWWRARFAAAHEFMESRVGQPKALIVVAAQHPLIDGREPNEEFSRRLAVGRNQAHAELMQGRSAEIYVPGSPHKHDEVSLAEVGGAWLRTHDLSPRIVVHGMDANEQYKGEDGVYNGADEAFVAAELFKADDQFGALHVACSPAQAIRWELHALANGVAPIIHAVSVPGAMYHDNAAEARLITYTRYVDPTWQSKASLMGQLTRRMRRP